MNLIINAVIRLIDLFGFTAYQTILDGTWKPPPVKRMYRREHFKGTGRRFCDVGVGSRNPGLRQATKGGRNEMD